MQQALGLPEPFPILAQLVVASPIEAAIHDAYGKAHNQNSYNLLGPEWVAADLSHYLSSDFSGEYLDRYTPEQRRRHEVRPGITGWAQVNGRNAITWEEANN